MTALDNVHVVDDKKYKEAATIVTDYIKNTNFQFESNEADIEESRKQFLENFSPEKLENIPDSELLKSIFLNADDNSSNSLCHYLEYAKKSRAYFGAITGGSAYKYGLFRKKEDSCWYAGSNQNPQKLTEDEALKLGKDIRDRLVKGVKFVKSCKLNDLSDYVKMHNELQNILDKYLDYSWIQKYLQMTNSGKLSTWYSDDWQRHILRGLQIKPDSRYYVRSGQLALITKYTDLPSTHFDEAVYAKFGNIKKFYRLNTKDDKTRSEWAEKKKVAIGFGKIGPLTNFIKGKNKLLSSNDIVDDVHEKYFKNESDKKKAKQKAREIAAFYNTNADSVIVATSDSVLVALINNVGNYEYDLSSEMAHCKEAKWNYCFSKDEKLPTKTKGDQSSFYKINDEENLLFLYKKYYYDLTDNNSEIKEAHDHSGVAEQSKIVYETKFKSIFEYNRIAFGAPGTGKSWTINKDLGTLIGKDNETDYERVTFHPDYSYANFVGTYKPTPCYEEGKNSITYKYVPGPFMRVYVKALKNASTLNVKPYVLVIEEINRANVAAVFGDVFQLLDRDEKGVSEYPIEASEDIKNFLAAELGGSPDDYAKIRIPNNMFIWATMNSADQGVFPMDTAFKRRWDFTYIGINKEDGDISGKYVTLGKDSDQKVEWNKLRKAINNFLAKSKINEDKQLGPYFIPRKIVVPENGDEIKRDVFINTFKNKVIMYLFEDAAKQKRSSIFAGCNDKCNRYSEICDEFDNKGIKIFHNDIVSETLVKNTTGNAPIIPASEKVQE